MRVKVPARRKLLLELVYWCTVRLYYCTGLLSTVLLYYCTGVLCWCTLLVYCTGVLYWCTEVVYYWEHIGQVAI